jgi:trans-aconitate methyltransferase
MNPIDRATILSFHRNRIKDFGTGTPEALGWKTPDSQRRRFDVLAEIADLNDHTVLDVGCGHGDMRAHLGEIYPRLRYAGIEQMKPFLEVAFERYRDLPDTSFYYGDFSTATLAEVDYVLASGALGYRSSDPDFVLQMITRLFGACRIGFGFNMLRKVAHPEGVLAAYEPDLIIAHCHQLTSQLVLKEGYLEDDFTVFMYHTHDE